MLLKLNLQRFAAVKYAITMNYDSNVTSVDDNDGTVFTTSGETKHVFTAKTTYTFTVGMTQGYELDSVTSNEGNISNVSGNSFQFINSYDMTAIITITTKKSTSQVSIDLTTLSGWGNVTSGDHVIQVVAKADGYRDSEKSTAVNFTKAPQVYTDCLTFTGETSEFTLKATYKDWNGTLEWSTDHITWTTLTGTEAMQSIDKKLYLRGKGNTSFGKNYGVIWQLSTKAGCSGNIQTLLDWENPPISISDTYCYLNMFYDCTNLTTAPELPATTLVNGCYNSMFYGCTNLTTAPQLPAETLVDRCYFNMFYGCTKLKVNTSSGNKIFICPTSIPTKAVEDMFTNTGGSFAGTPTAGNTYYWTA